jgi:hypothetical protein
MKIRTNIDIVSRDWKGEIQDFIPEGSILTVVGSVDQNNKVVYYKVKETWLSIFSEECEILEDQD